MQMWLLIHFKKARTVRRHRREQRMRVQELAPVFLPPALRRAPIEFAEGPTGIMFQWQSPDVLLPRPIAAEGGRVLALSGHTTVPDLKSSKAILAAMRVDGIDVCLRQAPGGMASYGLLHETGVSAWSSNPAVESVFVAESRDFVCVGSRPLAVHLVANNATRPTISQDFLRRLLLRGFPASDLSPFEGTRFLPPRSRLCLRGAKLAYVALPAYDDEPQVPASLDQAIEMILPELQAATRSLPSDIPTDFWLSGGKDSRLLAALLKDQGRPAIARTMAPEGHGEELVARRIADLCGLEYVVNNSVQICISGARYRVAAHLRATDALICEAHLAIWPPFAEIGMGNQV